MSKLTELTKTTTCFLSKMILTIGVVFTVHTGCSALFGETKVPEKLM